MATNVKRLGGLKNIYFAPITKFGTDVNDTTFGTPRLEGAKKIESSLTYEGVEFFSDDIIDFSDYTFAGGEGTLTLKALAQSDYNLLFGNKVNKGGVAVKSTDISVEGAFLFERSKLGSSHKRLYVVYSCKCSPTSISAETKEGSITEEVVEITFSVRELADNLVYYFMDTDAQDVDNDSVTGWYTEVRKPIV